MRQATGSITSAQPALSAAPSWRLPSSPIAGRSTHVATIAPAAAPTALNPYNDPTADAARSIRWVRARARSGSDAPMKNVGQRRLTNRISAIVPRPRSSPPRRSYSTP